jgi:hypothetical protein
MAITTVIKVAISACYLPHESMGALNCVVRRKNRTKRLKFEEWLEHTITGRILPSSLRYQGRHPYYLLS